MTDENQVEQQAEQNQKKGVTDSINDLKKKLCPAFRYSLILSLAIYLAMFIIGCYAVHKCPVEENIPLFLIITGVVGLLSKLISYLRDHLLNLFDTKFMETALYTIEVGAFIVGAYWVYKHFKPSFNPSDGQYYCNKTAYMFAFVYLTVVCILFITMLVGFSCFVLCICFLARFPAKQTAAESESQVPYVDETSDTATVPATTTTVTVTSKEVQETNK